MLAVGLLGVAGDLDAGGEAGLALVGRDGAPDLAALAVRGGVADDDRAFLALLGTGEERAIVKNGKVDVATLMSVTLSCDHRAVDGALGAELLVAFKTLIENPVMMVV